ncbi:hypothetical protein FB192DRAFT_1271212 [Mucor lusitanicus]|uniref:RRM domain-containing protein n=1 Tax=Mucor circinelloides f. lusitanicus TaxID=29924 RepID=A0A8H4BR55_MUCCL|nr:hypothetical protein FB192DRAFT_1271212 [Mucor lusitanicus]
MTEPSTSENKTSVVDDFFSALFANTSETSNISNNSSSDNSASSSRDATATPIPTNSTNEQQATPPVLDEFDEYSLLSKRRQSDSTSNLNGRTRPDTEQPAQTLAKRHIDWSKVIPESRMLIHQLPKSTSKQELMDYFSKYGEVLEVVQKNTFGFVHFENPEQCARAVEAENYKTFNDVLLNLEICKRKPKFARLTENENRRRIPGHRGNNRLDTSRSPSRSRSPPPARNYNNNNNYGSSNNNNNNTTAKRRNMPAVQIISWNTDNALMNYIDSLFTQKHIRTDARAFNYLNHPRGELIKQMVLEGVKAIVLIDGRNSEQGKVYLQVFAPVDHGDGVRYDEYDSVTPNEAVSIVQNTHPELRQAKPRYQPYTSQYNSNNNNTRRDSHNTKPQYNTASQYSGPSYGRSSEAPYTNTNSYQKPVYYNNATRGPQYASPPVQQQQQQRYQAQPNYVTQSAYQQPQAISAPPPAPSIPQLLATLVNSLGATGMAHHTPPSAPAPLPAAPATTTTPGQPSMAALLSTATGGNPALAQLLLQQMTSRVTNASSPTPPNAQASPTLVSQTNQPQQDYGYSSYGHQRN